MIRNPGCEYGKWSKENVGVKSRHGFTYGKWTVKAKLTELLNRNNLWNGLTNAIWLITQGQADWNLRRDCNKEGYMANYYGGSNDKRVKNIGYSEIDFEILKTVPYCPSYLLPPATIMGSTIRITWETGMFLYRKSSLQMMIRSKFAVPIGIWPAGAQRI